MPDATYPSTTNGAVYVGGGAGGAGGMTQEEADARYLQQSQNLADLDNPETAVTNLSIEDGGFSQGKNIAQDYRVVT